ncbi:pyroglutamyl-peptidase I [Georgenia sp. MJ170]|uniref:pyroglutamyl-peptidase I family protein n=1 Tax=Georgenia sunbinii TaxID=3117728 RepID=UPI002F26AFC2
MTRILLTGFGPFGHHLTNPSQEAVELVAEQWSPPDGTALVTATLPVSFARATALVGELIVTHRPDVVVSVGLAAGRHAISLERVGVNLVDARIPDVDGAQPVDVPVVPGGPPAVLTTLPVKAGVAALRDAGLPAELSLSAGSYVCNAVMYAAGVAAADGGDGVRAGFVHVPAANDLPVADVARGLGIVLDTILATTTDLAVPGGRED